MIKNWWCFLCQTCDYGRQYPAEWQAVASAETHRYDHPGHTTVTHFGNLKELTTPARS